MAVKRRYALQDLTWLDFRERLSSKPVILLPLGSQEEQGPHAPMGDFVAADRIALAAAERADAIAAPVLPFGYADFFRSFAGGVQLRADTFRAVLEDMIVSFLDHGLEHVLIANGHSTNSPLIADVAHKIRRERGLIVPSINLWRALTDADWRRLHGEAADRARGHGADPLTSVMLHIAPQLVDMDLAAPARRQSVLGLPSTGQFASALFDGAPVEIPVFATEVAADGTGSGDPRCARAEIGQQIVETLVDWTARFITHFRQCDPRDPRVGPGMAV